ncbi:MAG TPA: hypothetical protein VES20_14985 [Bryobacteraceae bacterium]|nr:hypothetical protein [Bryobacteraceae bacterium]
MKYLGLLMLGALTGVAEPVLVVTNAPPTVTFSADAPKPPFRFEKEESSGSTPKVIVQDAADRRWIVKFGLEVKAETLASRLVHAAGFYAEPAYYLAEGTVEGASDLRRAGAHIKDGRFTDARFELMNPRVKYLDQRWTLRDDQLQNTQELGALKALIALLANWDVKPENMSVVAVDGKQYYAVTDWGRTMGRAEEKTGRSQWDCANYARDSEHFVQEVQNGFVTLNYAGKQRYEVLRGIRVEHAKWLASRLKQISDADLTRAVQASGASAEEVTCFVPAIRKRVTQLDSIASGAGAGETIRSRKVTTTTTTTPQP